MKILQLNTTIGSGSTGRIAEEIGNMLLDNKCQSYIASGKGSHAGVSECIRIGNKGDLYMHFLVSRVFDRHGFASRRTTRDFIRQLHKISPDIIHLHNIHGYYLNIRLLFDYLKAIDLPVVWTFHDCWPITGHCSFFDAVECMKWKSACYNCPNLHGYPESYFIDNSRKNYQQKRALFTGLKHLFLVSPSQWLANHLSNSFLKQFPVKVINNGVDLKIVKPVDPQIAMVKFGLSGKPLVLGVANVWDKRKGYDDFVRLRNELNADFEIVLVGLTPRQIKKLPGGIKGITRTESIEDLVALYSAADIFVNPTYVDNFPTVNLESLACGTPVITYQTGGCPEMIDNLTGRVVQKGDILQIKDSIGQILNNPEVDYSANCRQRAIDLYDKNKRYHDYFMFYEEVLSQK